MKTTEKSIDQIKEELKSKLRWRNDYQKHSTDGYYYLVATIGVTETLYVLSDEDDKEVDRWKES